MSLDVCGQNISCISYFSDPNSLKTSGKSLIKSWNITLNSGLNTIYDNESVTYDKGVMVYMKFIDGNVAIDSQPYKTVQDYIIKRNGLNFVLYELHQSPLDNIKYKFCVKVLTNKYIYQDQYSIIKTVIPGFYSIQALFYNDDYNFYFVKEFNFTGIRKL